MAGPRAGVRAFPRGGVPECGRSGMPAFTPNTAERTVQTRWFFRIPARPRPAVPECGHPCVPAPPPSTIPARPRAGIPACGDSAMRAERSVLSDAYRCAKQGMTGGSGAGEFALAPGAPGSKREREERTQVPRKRKERPRGSLPPTAEAVHLTG